MAALPLTGDCMINRDRNRVSEISDVFLESESEEVNRISDLANDSSYLIVRLLNVLYNNNNNGYL